jgi:hypothetical protein
MVRVESVGDWLLLSDADTVFTYGARYVVQFDTEAQTGLLRIDSPSRAEGIELHATWPVTSRGSLVAGDTQQSLSGFRLTVLPDEPTHKVLPYREMIIALRDDGALAARIEADSEPPPALPTDRKTEKKEFACASAGSPLPHD